MLTADDQYTHNALLNTPPCLTPQQLRNIRHYAAPCDSHEIVRIYSNKQAYDMRHMHLRPPSPSSDSDFTLEI